MIKIDKKDNEKYRKLYKKLKEELGLNNTEFGKLFGERGKDIQQKISGAKRISNKDAVIIQDFIRKFEIKKKYMFEEGSLFYDIKDTFQACHMKRFPFESLETCETQNQPLG